jgi:acyl-coenzyme A thioesterase PaaI-like protein
MSERVDLDPDVFGPQSPCFGCSPTHPFGFHLRFAREGEEVVTRFTPGDRYQGPPGVMHGGLVTALADEIAAWTIIGVRERFGFTASLEARLRRPVRIGVELIGRGRIAKESSRIFVIEVFLEQGGQEAFRGLFTFAILDESAAERFLGGPLPDAWKRFAR